MKPNEFWCAVSKIHDEWMVGASPATMQAGAHLLDRLLDKAENEPWVEIGLVDNLKKKGLAAHLKTKRRKRDKRARAAD